MRVLFLLALGAALAASAFLWLRRSDTRRGREADAWERSVRQARDQQAATAEVLTAIAASPPDLQRVLDTIARNATRVCDGLFAVVFRLDGPQIRLAAHQGLSPTRLDALNQRYPRGLDDEGLVARAIREASVVHCPALQSDPRVPGWVREVAAAEGFRSMVIVPMLREGRPLGTLNVSRPEGGFTERQIQLLRTFADQAVIAIENVRLFQELEARNRELSDALERQTATGGILRAIATSPTDPRLAFEAILESTLRLCGATLGGVLVSDGRLVSVAAVRGRAAILEAIKAAFPRRLTDPGFTTRAIRQGVTVHVADILEDPSSLRELDQAGGMRAELYVPMLREGRCIGAICIQRDTPGLFSEAQVALMHTLADQAAIAVENVRLFQELQARNRELTESLEQQTATGAILRVMSGSPTDIQPVLDAVAESATRLCDARDVSIALVDQGVLRVVASHGLLARWWPDEGVPISRGSVTGRAVVDRQTVHIHDLASESNEEFPEGKAYQRLGGHRTNLAVPLLKEGAAIGVIAMRRGEIRPFTDRQVQLLETFAAQAVIAIENVRLFKELETRNRELTESLEQQTATASVLRAISSSPMDTQPVFDMIAESAGRLCEAHDAVVRTVHDGYLEVAAIHGSIPTMRLPIHRAIPSGRAFLDRETVHVLDLAADLGSLPEELAEIRGNALEVGIRTVLIVPLVREGAAIGVIAMRRRVVRPFTEKQIALVKTFAAQAVIAIENVRLFQELQARNRELTESLEQQTATAEILQIISRSPTDLQPIFDAIAESALRLCDGLYSGVYRVEADRIHLVALHEVRPEAAGEIRRGWPRPLDRDSIMGQAIVDRAVVHSGDTENDPGLPARARDRLAVLGYRSVLTVPMLRGDSAIGAIRVARAEAKPFSEKQIALLQTFADQAVIAVENVRLFQELEARNRELTEALEQQTATSEVLGAISRSPTDLQPIYQTILANVTRLCDANIAALFLWDGEFLDAAAHQNATPEFAAFLDRGRVRPSRETPTRRAALERRVVHVVDVLADPEWVPSAAHRLENPRTVLSVPMLRDAELAGVITAWRREVRPFSDRQIALVKTFADQALIAIENVRLFQELEARNRELTESLEQQTATGEILRVISSSPTDVQPVFDAIAANAERVCEAENANVYRFDGSLIHLVASHGYTAEELSALQGIFPVPPGQGSATARAVSTGAIAHIPNMSADSDFAHPALIQAGFRTSLSVPMLREGQPIGAITVARREMRPFSDRQISLLQTFAAQAVIAVENVRLFTELGARNRELTEALEQQTATGEILRAISSSPTDAQPVFDTIARSAMRLCEGAFTTVCRYDGELLHLAAHSHARPEGVEVMRQAYPMRPSRINMIGRAILTGAVAHVVDAEADPEYGRAFTVTLGNRSSIGVPMLRDGRPIGAIMVGRLEVRPFSDVQIALLQTFADQAVIAVENVRLFQELEARNRELTESLEQQTATAEILRVISSSPTDLRPVFGTIVRNATRICEGLFGAVYQYDGELVHFVAHENFTGRGLELLEHGFPAAPSRDSMIGRAILSGSTIHIPDLEADEDVPAWSREVGRALGYRSLLIVPMLREGRPIGAIAVSRGQSAFSERQIDVVRTFADQAVIAIENVRLFQELQRRTRELARSVEELQALSEVGRAVSSTLDLPTVLATIVARAVQLSDTSGGVLYEYDEAARAFHLRASHRTEAELVEALRASPIQLGEGATGQAVVRRAPVEVADILEDREYQLGARATLTRLGYRSILSVPLLLEQRILGALTVSRREPGHFPPETVNLLQTFATQSALAIQNARLFREIETKGRELEVASRHKSQFLANMSHELRTPLNAILGYTELLVDGIYGDLSPKAGDVMLRIDRSGKHLLGLINDVLDLSKIEAGQLELALAEYSLREVVHAVVTQVESLAAEKGLTLSVTVPPDLPAGRGDDRRLAQVLLNLVGNAIKFTEAGEVRIAGRMEGDAFVVSVADTGPGIAEADRQRIFEEFQQADSSSTRKKGGTGLGLSIARRIVELHGGRIWVESTVGRGSTFSFRVPVRVERQVARG